VPEPVLPEHSVARRLNRELFLLLGGTAALLMQVAHPLVAAGVEQHSDFRRDPFGRLRRTLNTTLAVVFAEPDAARTALRRIDRRHGPVRGTAADGRAYEARDPALLLWVQATLLLTSLRLYEAVLGRLTPSDREAYLQETRPIAALLGIPAERLPATIGDLERYERQMLGTVVRPDETSRRVGRQVLHPFASIPRPIYWPSDALTSALVPEPLRRTFGLRYRRREHVFFAMVIATVRIARAVLPPRLTVVPHARRFERGGYGPVPSSAPGSRGE
jgi:uncharacterized protein (DUF2236 family)